MYSSHNDSTQYPYMQTQLGLLSEFLYVIKRALLSKQNDLAGVWSPQMTSLLPAVLIVQAKGFRVLFCGRSKVVFESSRRNSESLGSLLYHESSQPEGDLVLASKKAFVRPSSYMKAVADCSLLVPVG